MERIAIVIGTCNHDLFFEVGVLDPVEGLTELGISTLLCKIACMYQYVAFRQFECTCLWGCVVCI